MQKHLASSDLQRSSDFDAPPPALLDIDQLLAAVRRQWSVAALCITVCAVLGAAYALTAVPRYTSSAALLIDSANLKIVDQLSAIGGTGDDEASILSQVELLRSSSIRETVVDNLGLADNQAFLSDRASLLSTLREVLSKVLHLPLAFGGPAEPPTLEERKASASALLAGNLDVRRVGRTFVLDVAYTSTDPALAARIAQGFAEAYLTDQLDSKYDATRRASGWLQDRIAELRQKSLETDLAVQKFRAENGLIATGGGLVSDQQLSQLNAQLVVAQAATAEAEARFRSVESIIESGELDAAVTDSLDNSIINQVRSQYLDASRREADISSRLGASHEQAVRLRSEMAEYRRQMFAELSRIADSYRSAFQIAQAREAALQNQVAAATGVSTTANDAQVQLRELEREADTYRNLYQTFLQRYQEAIQQQSFPVTEARVISEAEVPSKPSAPNVPMSIALSIGAGLGLSLLLGGVREFRERFFRTGEQVRSELGLEFLGFVPAVGGAAVRRGRTKQADEHAISKARPLDRYAVQNPTSLFSETLRSVRLAVDFRAEGKKSRVIGVVSSAQGEGKSVIAINLAQQLAAQGAQTLLIDADMRNPAATRALAPNAKRGLLQALLEQTPVEQLLFRDADTGLMMLPTVTETVTPFATELLSSRAMDDLLAGASGYDYVVVDLPALGPVVDARAIASRIDAFVFVVEWGKTSRRTVRNTLQVEWKVAERCVGAVLNKVNTSRLKLYQVDGSDPTYYGNYGRG